jgi:hypothetical protein
MQGLAGLQPMGPAPPTPSAAPPAPQHAAFSTAPATATATAASPGGYPYPPLAPEQAAAFSSAFAQLDSDNDGFISGADCFATFMRSGLPKEALKQVWDIVAGDAGQLSRHQFVQALYLIECIKRGIPLPARLPPGQFPPVSGAVNFAQMMGQQQDIYSATAGRTALPMPPRAVYVPGASPLPQVAFQSQVPAFASERVAALAAAEQERIRVEREAALAQEAERKRVSPPFLVCICFSVFFAFDLPILYKHCKPPSSNIISPPP